MVVDKKYCMSSFLMFRTIADDTKCFKEGMTPQIFRGGVQTTGRQFITVGSWKSI